MTPNGADEVDAYVAHNPFAISERYFGCAWGRGYWGYVWMIGSLGEIVGRGELIVVSLIAMRSRHGYYCTLRSAALNLGIVRQCRLCCFGAIPSLAIQ